METNYEFPKHMYHPNGSSFICPSAEFLASMANCDEFEDRPFTGPRKPVKVRCKACVDHARELKMKDSIIAELTLTIEILEEESKAKDPVEKEAKRAYHRKEK